MNQQHFYYRRAFLIPAALISVLIFVLSLQIDFLFTPKVQAVSPDNAANAELNSTIVFDFSRPVDRSTLTPVITPELEGEWMYENPVYGAHLFRRVRFIPSHTLAPETTYTIQLLNLQSVFPFGEKQNLQYAFTTQELPDVASVTPVDAAKDIIPTTSVTITLDIPNPDIAEFEFVMQPERDFTQEINDALDTYTLTFAEPLAQGTEHTVEVYRTSVQRSTTSHEVVYREEPEKVYRGTFTTAPPPNVETVLPTGDQVHVDNTAQITFSEAMDLASLEEHFVVSPETAGNLTLSEDATIVTFTPSANLSYGTAYTLTIGAGTTTQDEGFLEEDAQHSFTTIGSVAVSRTTPQDGNTGVGINSGIEVTFNQEVDHASAEERFSIDPSTNGTFTWENNTLRFQPSSPFAYNVTYTARIAKDVKSIYGLDLPEEYSFRFATEPEVFKMAIGVDLQDKSLSCEAAALKMALAGKGIYVSESDIMYHVGYDPTPHVGNTWGDPYLAYVGDISGRQNTTGYGVYWDPIARAANQWRPSESFTGWTTTQLTQEIAKGNAVVVWGIYGSGYEDSWETPEGKHIYAWKGEHARTAIGYVGSVDNPSQIILNDPYAGQIYWSRSRFEQDWGIFGNAGVVVR